MKHFPGPYQYYSEHGVAGIRMGCPEDCPNKAIHETHELITPQQMRSDLGNLNRREEFRATWRLMAAAPELLESIESLLLLIEHETDLPKSAANGVTDNSGTVDQGIVLASRILQGAREAIKKAKGEK